MSDPSMTDPKNSPVTRRPPGAVPERTQSVAAWMPFYIGDYLRETSRLTTEGHGAYLLLLFDYWTSGTALPDDDGQLAQIVRSTPAAWRRLRPQLERFFSVANGVWRHARSDRELAKTQRLSDERSRAGSRGAAQRWQSHGPAIAKDMASEVTTGMTQPLATGVTRARQNDGQPQPQSQPQPPSQPQPQPSPLAPSGPRAGGAAVGGTARRPSGGTRPAGVPWSDAGPGDDASEGAQIVWSFHTLRRHHLGLGPPATLRPDEIALAEAWVALGATFELCRVIFDERLRRTAERGETPPMSLKFFDLAVRERLDGR